MQEIKTEECLVINGPQTDFIRHSMKITRLDHFKLLFNSKLQGFIMESSAINNKPEWQWA